jgi:hypothetical protein
MAEALVSAEADAVCGAGYGERAGERVNRRNGYRERERDWDTGRGPWNWPSRSCGPGPTSPPPTVRPPIDDADIPAFWQALCHDNAARLFAL